MKLANIYMTLSEVRKNRELAQTDIAEALNVEQATVSLYENGKRGIPLDLLDDWLKMLEIEVTITPKEYESVKRPEDIKNELITFNQLKKRRNYLIAELRSLMAESIAKVPELQGVGEDEEPRFWPFSFFTDTQVGVVETRYDHPEQKFLAVEYTANEVNLYKFLPSEGKGQSKEDGGWIGGNKAYLSEDEFLALGWQWNQDRMDNHKITILRRNKSLPEGIEVVDPSGFSLRTLLEIQANYNLFAFAVEETEHSETYMRLDLELDVVHKKMLDITLNNRLKNGALDPVFDFWTEQDKEAIDIPLWGETRSWEWVEEGMKWTDDLEEVGEIHVLDNSIPHDHFHIHRHENGNRIIGLIGLEQKPAVFKSNVKRPDMVYRVCVEEEELNEQECTDYQALLNATKELDGIRSIRENDKGVNEGVE